jgi:hypothetical protein
MKLPKRSALAAASQFLGQTFQLALGSRITRRDEDDAISRLASAFRRTTTDATAAA